MAASQPRTETAGVPDPLATPAAWQPVAKGLFLCERTKHSA